MEHFKIVIIGSGPAGLTAAIYSARANLSPLLLHGPLPMGQLTTTTEVENFPGFPNGIQGPELMENMESQAKRFGTEIRMETVESVDFKKKPFLIETERSQYTCDSLILATGANPKYLGIPGERELLGYGVSTCATCDGAFFRDQVITVVGGGDSACEEAIFLSRFASKLYLVHRRDELRASKIMQERVFSNSKISVVWDSVVTEVRGSKSTGVTSVLLSNLKTSQQSELETAAVFVAIGHVPNTKLVEGLITLDESGYIVPIKAHSTATNIDGVFACGDVQDSIYRQAITAAGSGCMAALEAERFLEG